MTRGIRGATTVRKNDSSEIIANTKQLLQEMVEKNNISPDAISHMFISATDDLNAVFPAKAAREFAGWTYVPVMCMREINVPGSLAKCIRVMMVVNSDMPQEKINHIYHGDATILRPDLIDGKEDEEWINKQPSTN
ncbi:chorismate mutase [Virgibacillus sp. 179-BFC.A HS]|uniref:chorismate mutase n=1 Tax=Tigheibacillus jepli TaxID=3035914 RepID=A0ABU5CH69_9BACI|nr:chorismate mutase [Virgibacillus sp. 179-BFC.A HS]MDY0405703.1 chorismate mutase [Virgibacillus sp. 179-BFC.A HS]